jgi:hypothetical protein
MPKTFREAVVVCHVLKIKYLWIDSLCICQDKDDTSDWTHEAGLINKAYASSYCNLSASDAKNSTHGLFRDRDPSVLKYIKINVPREDVSGQISTKQYCVDAPDA